MIKSSMRVVYSSTGCDIVKLFERDGVERIFLLVEITSVLGFVGSL